MLREALEEIAKKPNPAPGVKADALFANCLWIARRALGADMEG